jgi:hypothetical protein
MASLVMDGRLGEKSEALLSFAGKEDLTTAALGIRVARLLG